MVSTVRLLSVTLGMLLLAGTTGAAQPGGKKPPKKKRRPNPALAPIQNQEGLPRVLLIGDSISIGYTLPTRKLLEGKANVHRIPVNGGPSSRGVSGLKRWLGAGKWDVIHFNWGLHDLKGMPPDNKHQVPIEQYQKNMKQLVADMRKTGAKLFWASTTPVPEGGVKPHRTDADVVAYNEVAATIMRDNGIAVNDLYALAKPRLAELQLPVNVHFKPEGSQELAKQVAGAIENALAEQ